MKHRLTSTLLTLILATLATPLAAELSVKFVESAPKDWFAVTNNSNCKLDSLQMDIDLTDSVGKLIFDTTSTGAGVEVFQPFEIRSGNIELISAGDVKDGDKSLSVLIKHLQPGETASFTIDVDDTLTNSELGMIRVSQSEIRGTKVVLTVNSEAPQSGQLNNQGNLNLSDSICI